MMDFSTNGNLLCPAQYGFRNKLSCVDAMAAVTEYMLCEFGKKAQGRGCFIGLQKVSDTLDQKILVSKLNSFGFRRKIHDIIGRYSQELNNMSLTSEQIYHA